MVTQNPQEKDFVFKVLSLLYEPGRGDDRHGFDAFLFLFLVYLSIRRLMFTRTCSY